MRGGLLLLILGAFVLARTVTHDASGLTLVDRLLGKKTAAQDFAAGIGADGKPIVPITDTNPKHVAHVVAGTKNTIAVMGPILALNNAPKPKKAAR